MRKGSFSVFLAAQVALPANGEEEAGEAHTSTTTQPASSPAAGPGAVSRSISAMTPWWPAGPAPASPPVPSPASAVGPSPPRTTSAVPGPTPPRGVGVVPGQGRAVEGVAAGAGVQQAATPPLPPQQQQQQQQRGGTAPLPAAAASADGNSGEVQVADMPLRNEAAALQVLHRQLTSPALWSAVGKVAGGAWAVVKVCHRLLAPVAAWALRNLRTYVEEQLAIQQAMAARTCPVPKYGEKEVLQATDDMGFTRRSIGTPYGMVVYRPVRLGGLDAVVRQAQLGSLADVDDFWSEVAAGRALRAAPPHPAIAAYWGACPPLACHVYQDVPYTCTLRQALAAGSRNPHAAALGCWEGRLAIVRQLVDAAAHLVRSDVAAQHLCADTVVLLRLQPEAGAPAREGDERAGADRAGAPGGAAGPRCLLAPGCGLRAPLCPPAVPLPPAAQQQQRQQQQQQRHQPQHHHHQQQQQWQQWQQQRGNGRQQQQQPLQQGGQAASAVHAGSAAAAGGAAAEAGGAGGRVGLLARDLGTLLMQVLAGTDWPPAGAGPAAAATLLAALADAAPARLLAAGVAPPLTDAQVWPLLAAVYPLLAWGGGGTAAGAAAGAGAAARQQRPAGQQQGPGAGGGDGSDGALALQAHLLREVAPAAAELQVLLRRGGDARRRQRAEAEEAAASARAGGGGREGGVVGGGGGGAGAVEDPFAGASAPPLLPPDAAAAPSAPPPPPGPVPATAAGGAGASSAGSLPPQEFLCPITHELMDDPVVAADGHSYERAAIAGWMEVGGGARGGGSGAASPLTGAALPHAHLTPNYALRSVIRDWRARHGV